eukprot:scaffold72535_cov65-Phaeocystis_antarctica.AAC.2
MSKGGGVGDCGQAPERHSSLASASTLWGHSSRAQKVALRKQVGFWSGEAAAHAAASQGTLAAVTTVTVRAGSAGSFRVWSARTVHREWCTCRALRVVHMPCTYSAPSTIVVHVRIIHAAYSMWPACSIHLLSSSAVIEADMRAANAGNCAATQGC